MAEPTQNFGAGTISIGTTASPTEQFECQITAFTIVPSQNSSTVAGTYCSAPTQRSTKSSFGITMGILSDWGAVPSISQLLWDSDGSLLFFSFVPEDPAMPDADGQFWAVAAPFGGPGNDVWTATGTMPCPEKPTVTPKA
jgi:hypothetical protein